jgi:hypothetical protein
MKTFVADIIPKIQRFSKKLDNVTLLTNQHWVVLDELMNSKTVYIFRPTGELLISINGKVEKAKWEYLGKDSILIDLKEGSYLFRHGFFDENILALKIDSKDEYAMLINETSYGKELDSITSVNTFLNQKYIIPPVSERRKLENSKVNYKEKVLESSGYNLRMGNFKKYLVKFENNKTCYIYLKTSNNKYYIYSYGEILLFPDFESCIDYIRAELLKK